MTLHESASSGSTDFGDDAPGGTARASGAQRADGARVFKGAGMVASALAVGAMTQGAQATAAPEGPPPEIQSDTRDHAREIRSAQRALATTRLAPHRDALHAEEEALKRSKYAGAFSDDDARRLAYVRWQIHMIEEAEVGPSLDALERLAEINGKLAATMKAIGQRVQGAPRTGRRGRR